MSGPLESPLSPRSTAWTDVPERRAGNQPDPETRVNGIAATYNLPRGPAECVARLVDEADLEEAAAVDLVLRWMAEAYETGTANREPWFAKTDSHIASIVVAERIAERARNHAP